MADGMGYSLPVNHLTTRRDPSRSTAIRTALAPGALDTSEHMVNAATTSAIDGEQPEPGRDSNGTRFARHVRTHGQLPGRSGTIGAMPDWSTVLASMPECELQPPATEDELRRVEADLDFALPQDLRELYLTSNGVYTRGSEYYYLWPIDRVSADNMEPIRSHPWLIAFGDNGCGEPFCVRRDGAPGIFYCYPMADEVHQIADTLVEFWIGWHNGTIGT
jgi:hypothetical protein